MDEKMNSQPAQSFRPRLEADGTITRLPVLPEPAIPTWDEYLASDKAARDDIALRWCRVGFGYAGNGSQRKEATELYIKSCNLRRADGELKPKRSPDIYSTNPLDDDRAIIISESQMRTRDGAYDAARDNEGHR